MSIDEELERLAFASVLKRPRTVYLSGNVPLMAPGGSCIVEMKPPAPFRPQKLVLNLQGSPPRLKPYQKKSGGSKRKGQLWSARFFADLLRHNAGNWAPSVTITDVRIGFNSQFVYGSRVPWQLFSPLQMDMGLNLEPADRNQVIAINLYNDDFSRDAWGVGAVFGLEMR